MLLAAQSSQVDQTEIPTCPSPEKDDYIAWFTEQEDARETDIYRAHGTKRFLL